MSENSNTVNSTDAPRAGHNSDGVNAGHLSAFIERIERLNEEKKALGEDIKEVYAEAKGNGFDPKIMRKVVALRQMDLEKRIEQETLIDIYMRALGDFVNTPLGKSAVERAAKPITDAIDRGELSVEFNIGGNKTVVNQETRKRGRPKKGAPLVGEDKGAVPRTGADDGPDLRSARQKDREALRVAEAEERLKGIKQLDEPVTAH